MVSLFHRCDGFVKTDPHFSQYPASVTIYLKRLHIRVQYWEISPFVFYTEVYFIFFQNYILQRETLKMDAYTTINFYF